MVISRKDQLIIIPLRLQVMLINLYVNVGLKTLKYPRPLLIVWPLLLILNERLPINSNFESRASPVFLGPHLTH